MELSIQIHIFNHKVVPHPQIKQVHDSKGNDNEEYCVNCPPYGWFFNAQNLNDHRRRDEENYSQHEGSNGYI